MHLALDARQKAMLREMGVKVWQSPATPIPQALEVSFTASTENPTLTPDAWQNKTANPVKGDSPTTLASQANNVNQAKPIAISPLPNIVSQATPHDANLVAPEALGALLPTDQLDALTWPELITKANDCDSCRLGHNRQKMVWGRFAHELHQHQNIALKTSVLVVLDPPSEYEEDAASPAVMQVGKLVHAMLKAAGLDSQEQPVFISNVSKCRIPTGLRNPQPDITICLAYLNQQIKRLQPTTILVLGWGAAQVLTPKMEPRPSGTALGHLRGVVQHYLGIPTIVSFAPAYLIRNPQDKAKTWDDLCLLMQCLEDKKEI